LVALGGAEAPNPLKHQSGCQGQYDLDVIFA
jgi:hypothetical protein